MNNMKISVAGLGIIGGSICMSLKRAGYTVAGWNRSEKPVKYALDNKIIDERAESFDYDVIFVALPPEATARFIDTQIFKDGCVVADICGVKKPIENSVYSKPRNFNYIGCHPMAGKEVSGIENACADLFDNANMVITRSDKTDKASLELMRKLTADMGFKYIVECSAETHDRKIAYTSQLAHIVSNAYVKNNEIDSCLGFTGGSFQDMTRIAGVDEQMWSALYLENAHNLSENIKKLTDALTDLREAIESGDRQRLIRILSDGRVRYGNCKNFVTDTDIFVQKLK